MFAIGLATAAHAQLGDPGEQAIDTDVTPVTKDSSRWNWVAGAKYSSDGPKPDDVPQGSATPFELDLFTVAFREKEDVFTETDFGFAGGAVCREPVPEGATPAEAQAHTDACERVPAIYRFSVNDVGEGSWEPVALPGSAERGYVGAISWIDHGRALAVGGTGNYPRRELPRASGESDESWLARNDAGEEPDAAGMARAWLYEGGTWQELEVPASMRGLTALDFSSQPGDCGEATDTECGFAAGLRQLWRWSDGGFDSAYSDLSPTTRVDRPSLLRFRVRDLEFSRNPGQAKALAATSGCCAADPLHNVPWMLVWDGERWLVRGRTDHASNAFYQESQREPAPLPERPAAETLDAAGSAYEDAREQWDPPAGCRLTPGFGGGPLGCVWDASGQQPPPPPGPEQLEDPAPEQTDAVDDTYQGPKQLHDDAHAGVYQGTQQGLDEQTSPYGSGLAVPDSFYSVIAVNASRGFGFENGGFTLIASPGGVPPISDAEGALSEPASQVLTGRVPLDRESSGNTLPSFADVGSRTGSLLSTLRLHDLDTTPVPGGNGFEAVGELRSTGQGVAFGPQERFPNRLDPHGCDTAAFQEGQVDCDPDAQRFIDAQGSLLLFKLPSYALNSVEVIDEVTGAGWAVGDHGAILGLAGATASQLQAEEPAPAELGARKQTPLADGGPYEEADPGLSGDPGQVPPLSSRPVQQLAEPAFFPAGSPESIPSQRAEREEVSAVVISRDGQEGWAVGPEHAAVKATELALHHYDGSRWVRCEGDGAGEADRACESIAALREKGLKLYAAARVPLERDSDPSNDDEFEVVAVGRYNNGGPAVLRYSDGFWELDAEATAMAHSLNAFGKLVDVAFTAPDDGWIVVAANQTLQGILRLDSRGWVKCTAFGVGAQRCANPDGRLPTTSAALDTQRVPQLTVAGERVYLAGTRAVRGGAGSATSTELYPVIIYLDPGAGRWQGSEDGSDGAYDPGFGAAFGEQAREQSGALWAASVGATPDGEVEGWAVGRFGGTGDDAEAVMLRLAGGRWSKWKADDASDDYLRPAFTGALDPRQALVMPAIPGPYSAFLFVDRAPAIAFNGGHERWEALPTPFSHRSLVAPSPNHGWGFVRALAPDNQGGFWAAVRQNSLCSSCPESLYFYHYTDRPHAPVFDDVPHPITETALGAAGGGDGSFWVATSAGVLYRYERMLGWERIAIPGWDPGRISINPSPVYAVAVGPGGEGIAVGPGGRIAEISPEEVRLDRAAGTLCDVAAPQPPCGTGRHLTAAAVAPDGSAIAAGEGRAILWRPAGGGFRSVEPPRIPKRTAFTSVSMPGAERAYLATDSGMIFAGERSGDAWSWRLESDLAAKLPTLDSEGFDVESYRINLQALAVGEDGHGYAVGPAGLILERDAGGSWSRLDHGFIDDFHSVALAPDGEGVLVGGENGLVLTLVGGRLEVAHPADPYDPVNANILFGSKVIAVAISPGPEPGQAEAWAAVRGGGTLSRHPIPQAILHNGSDPAHPLLQAQGRAAPLPDAPPPLPGELSLAAFGKQECHGFDRQNQCQEPSGAAFANEAIARRIVDELVARSQDPGGPRLALFTGDAVDNAGAGEQTSSATPFDRDLNHRRWLELVGDPLADDGLPPFSAIGGGDLFDPVRCAGVFVSDVCRSVKPHVDDAGHNLAWRQTMEAMPAPWEAEEEITGQDGFAFERLSASDLSLPQPEATTPDVTVEDLGGHERARAKSATIGGGADTHYALDVLRDEEPVARIAIVDTSLRSLAASDPQQQPIEAGGQERWLREVLCYEGSDTDGLAMECTREQGQEAIVLSNTPTYTYSDRIPPTETATDAATFETLMFELEVDVIISGRLGWNGLYYALGPGGLLHSPAPGESYPASEPEPLPGQPDPIPFVVAGSAGGKFGGAGGSAAEGFWQGYSIVRLDTESGDVRVEQRPVIDWVSLRGSDHVLEPRKRLALQSLAREVVGFDQPIRYIEIDSPAITHRYDLVLADPEEPWVPCSGSDPACTKLQERLASTSVAVREDRCNPYLCLPENVGTIDSTTGEVRAGNGKYPDTFAIAILSVGDHVATYPLMFKKSPSFVIQPFALAPPVLAPPSVAPNPPQPPSPPNPPQPNVPQPSVPEVPAPPPVPPIAASEPPEPQPPAPPAPPPPTEQPSPLSLTLAPPSIAIATPTAVIQPPTPPVNPAPPGGARREARQRQAAAQKSGADSDSEAMEEGVSRASDETRAAGGDAGGGPRPVQGASMSRREVPGPNRNAYTRASLDPARATFTPLEREQPSAWARGLLYSGGMTMAALILALAMSRAGPTPRRREPRIPAPAQSWSRTPGRTRRG